MGSEMCIRDSNMPYGEVDRIAKLVPNILNITLEEAVKQEPRLQAVSYTHLTLPTISSV